MKTWFNWLASLTRVLEVDGSPDFGFYVYGDERWGYAASFFGF